MSSTLKMSNAVRTLLGGKIQITDASFRHIGTCNLYLNKYGSREARFMRKVMGNKDIKRKPWYNFEGTVPVSPFVKTSVSSKGGQNQRRVAVLNKLFMRHISDMMATGELSKEIVGRGLEISRVKTASDFNRINVFWLAKGTEDDVEIEQILEKYSWQLRHELSQLIGVVPPLYFIKDKEYSKVVEVNRILATADFGEDYVPVDAGYRLKSEFAQTSQLSPEIVNKIQELEQDSESLDLPLPPMRNDVLGLKHTEIMNKIKQGMKKSKALHRQRSSAATTDVDSQETVRSAEDLSIPPTNINPTKEEFIKFLMQRKVQKKKASNRSKNYSPEMEMYEKEVLEDSKVAAEFMGNTDTNMDLIDDYDDEDRHSHRT